MFVWQVFLLNFPLFSLAQQTLSHGLPFIKRPGHGHLPYHHGPAPHHPVTLKQPHFLPHSESIKQHPHHPIQHSLPPLLVTPSPAKAIPHHSLPLHHQSGHPGPHYNGVYDVSHNSKNLSITHQL